MHALLTISDYAYAVITPHACNSLPDSLHKLLYLNNVKKHLKSHLFKSSLAHHDNSDVKHSWGRLCCLQCCKLCTLLTYLLSKTTHLQPEYLKHICELWQWFSHDTVINTAVVIITISGTVWLSFSLFVMYQHPAKTVAWIKLMLGMENPEPQGTLGHFIFCQNQSLTPNSGLKVKLICE